MSDWLIEKESESLEIRHRILRVLHEEQSRYQRISVVETVDFGRMLVLDGVIQTSLRDEYIYHEMLAHVPLCIHRHPRRVLVIGGGDGGTVREVLKHPEVEKVDLVEIDERVIAVSREYLPELSSGFADPRVTVHIEDGAKFVAQAENHYDVVLVDAPDPVGPAESIFSDAFYASVHKALRHGGVMSAQTESPFMQGEVVAAIYRRIQSAFPALRLYLAQVPSYSLGPWSFTLAVTDPDLLAAPRRQTQNLATRYYTPEVHLAAFALPPTVQQLLEPKAAMTEAKISAGE